MRSGSSYKHSVIFELEGLVLIAIVVAGYVWYVRAQELFRVAVRDGKPSLIRGHAPTGLLGRFSDALSNVTRGEIRAHKPHVPADSTATRQAPSGG
jgi:hypothetical protein